MDPRPATVAESAWPDRLAFAGLILAVALAGLLCLFPVLGFDVWWHIKTGELIATTHRIPRTDPFTYTALGRPWVTHEWLAELLFYGLHRLGGMDALVIFKAFLAALAVGLSAWAALLQREGRRALAAAAVGALLAGPLLTPRALERPHMLTALFLGLVLVLLRAESLTGQRRWRVALAPLFLLWANIHSGFVLGLGLIATYWIGEALSPRLGGAGPDAPPVWRERLAALGAAAAATLINPHHVHAFLYPFTLVSRQEVRDTIVELRSIFHPAFAGALFLKALLAAGLVAVAVIVASRRRICWAVVLPGIVFGLLAVKSVRGVSEFAVLVPLLIGAHGSVLGARRALHRALVALVVVATLAGGAAALRWGSPMGSEPNRRIGLGVDPVNVPAGAVRFLEAERPTGEIFNLMGFGGYLIYALHPEKRVYIDGRLDVFPPGFIDDYVTMVATGQGWDEAVDRYGITLALVSYAEDPARERGLRARLRDDPAWICVFFGDNTLLYARDVAENREMLARYGLGFDPSLRSIESVEAYLRGAAPADVEQTCRALERMAQLAPEEQAPALVLGQILDRSGRSAEAVVWLRRVAALGPADSPARLLLAGALLRSGAVDAARAELESLLRARPAHEEALVLLADLLRSQGHLVEAVERIERAVGADPGDFPLRLRAGAFNAEAGRLQRAREHFEAARRLRPGDPAVEQNLRILEQIESRGGAGAATP